MGILKKISPTKSSSSREKESDPLLVQFGSDNSCTNQEKEQNGGVDDGYGTTKTGISPLSDSISDSQPTEELSTMTTASSPSNNNTIRLLGGRSFSKTRTTMDSNDEDSPTTKSQTQQERQQKWHRIAAILNSGSTFNDILRRITLNRRQKALSHTGVGQAAFLIRDAFLGEVENPANGSYDPYIDPKRILRNAISVVCGRICSSRPVLRILHGAAWILLLLSFVEPPYWCRSKTYSLTPDSKGCEAFLTAKGVPASFANVSTLYTNDNVTTFLDDDDAFGGLENRTVVTDEVLYYPNSSSMILTSHQSYVIELICLAIIMAVILVRLGRDGMYIQTYLRSGPSQINRVIQLICIAAISICLYSDHRSPLPYLRLALLTSFLSGVKQDIQVVIQMIPEIVNVLTLLGLLMSFYAWFGCVVFVGTTEGKQYFSSFSEAFWTLWICVTTANYPDVMMPTFNQNRWVAVYFISFVIISYFFLMNVILAGVVNEYDCAMDKRKEDREALTDRNLRRAFALMDPDGRGALDRDTVMGLFLILNEDFPEFRTLSNEDTKLLFAILDKDGTNVITEAEFMDFGNVILLEFTKTSDYETFVERNFPRVFGSRSFQQFCWLVRSSAFEYAVDLVVLLNAFVIGIQSYPELSGRNVEINPKYWDNTIDTGWELFEAIFTAIYLLEVIGKLIVFGWKKYMEMTRNLFDFTITVMALVSSAIVYYPNEISDSRIIRMIVMMRVLRLLRLLSAMKRFQLLGAVSARILPAATNVCLLLFLLLYLFAAMGVGIFGGVISRDPTNDLSYRILESDYAENEYWANNFNDMLSAMIVLFNLLVVNSWTVYEAGFEKVTQSKWVRLFFFSFHILGVVLVSNLVIAFVIKEFLSQLAIFQQENRRLRNSGRNSNKQQGEVVGGGEAVIYERKAVFEGSQITGTETGTQGNYIARIRPLHNDNSNSTDEPREHAQLRRLFTSTNHSSDPGNSEASGE